MAMARKVLMMGIVVAGGSSDNVVGDGNDVGEVTGMVVMTVGRTGVGW